MKFSLEKGFRRSITYNFTGEAGIEESLAEHGKRHEFGDITWYPSTHMAVYRYDNRVPLANPGHGSFDFIGFQPNPIPLSQTIRASGTSTLCYINNYILYLYPYLTSSWEDKERDGKIYDKFP